WTTALIVAVVVSVVGSVIMIASWLEVAVLSTNDGTVQCTNTSRGEDGSGRIRGRGGQRERRRASAADPRARDPGSALGRRLRRPGVAHHPLAGEKARHQADVGLLPRRQ